MVGDEVTVTVLAMKGGQIRLGIDAPKHVAIYREEVYERVTGQQQQKMAGAQPQQTPANTA
jgi:carbon storage regulator